MNIHSGNYRPETLSSGNVKSFLPPQFTGNDPLSLQLQDHLRGIGAIWQEHHEADQGKRHERLSDHRDKARKALEEKEAAEREAAIVSANFEREQRERERLEKEVAELKKALAVSTDMNGIDH